MYYLLIIAGGLMTMDTIWLSTVCNGNLGTALPAIMGVPLLLIGLFRGFFIQWFRGVDEGRIITEDKSTSTWENFKFSKAILDERFPGASAAFVTTNFHVYRAGRVAIMNGIEAEGYGAKDVWYTAPNNYMRESIAVAVYKLRGLLI